ncbi:MAG: hypothetical protein M1834_004841 [Cirrosporium novae-zelandiae]|nr:MAG: hypothetical protein M1834_004841 [Cirrosporium novae-zelandiae]
MAEQSQVSGIQPTAGTMNLPMQDSTSGPERRSVVHAMPPDIAAEYPTLYKVGDKVWFKGARQLHGPYPVGAVYGDGKYRLDNDDKMWKDNVLERDLKAYVSE